MKALTTQDLTLRKFTPSDIPAVLSYTSDQQVIAYMQWGPNDHAATENFITQAIAHSEKSPITNFQYGVEITATGQLIGGGNVFMENENATTAEIGWVLHPDHWGKGYGTQIGQALLDHSFGAIPTITRVIAHCDAENIGSYKLMEKIGMDREAHFHSTRPVNPNATAQAQSPIYPPNHPRDEYMYAITKGQWQAAQAIAENNATPYHFDGHIDLPTLDNGNIRLVCMNKNPADPAKGWVPAYVFAICKGSEKIGTIDIRIGYKGGTNGDSLYYGGNIGYTIYQAHRGKGYAVQAVELILQVAKAHKMPHVLITNKISNVASRRVCEKLLATLLATVRLPLDLANERRLPVHDDPNTEGTESVESDENLPYFQNVYKIDL